jgi:hypothetical protein
MTNSLLAQLGLKAVALAWPGEALAYKNFQTRPLALAQA